MKCIRFFLRLNLSKYNFETESNLSICFSKTFSFNDVFLKTFQIGIVFIVEAYWRLNWPQKARGLNGAQSQFTEYYKSRQ